MDYAKINEAAMGYKDDMTKIPSRSGSHSWRKLRRKRTYHENQRGNGKSRIRQS